MKKFTESLDTNYINTQIDLYQIAYSFGYTEELKKKTSVTWITLKNDNDSVITINRTASPQWYFNRDEDGDKGNTFQFLLNRIHGNLAINQNPTKKDIFLVFQKVNNYLNLPINNVPERPSVKVTHKPKNTSIKELSKELNIGPFVKKAFLLKNRNISLTTLDHPIFKNRIFNSIKITNSGSKIPNVAFPKFDPETFKISGYEIRNKEFNSNLGNDSHLWISQLPKNIHYIAIVESAIDAISHFELHSPSNLHTLYVSLGGTLSQGKLTTINTLINNIQKNNIHLGIKLLTDNDINGTKYDIQLITDLIKNHTSYSTSLSFENKQVKLTIELVNEDLSIVTKAYNSLKNTIDTFNGFSTTGVLKAKVFQRKKTIDIEIPLFKNDIKNETNNIKGVLQKINFLFLPINVKFEKSILKDWNDELKNIKKNTNIKASKQWLKP